MIPAMTLLASGFWMLMIFDCVRNDPEKNTWLWILIFLNIPGAVIYFVVRRLPYINIPLPATFKRWTYRNKIWDAEAAAKNIGNAHQFITLGNLLTEARQLDRAIHSYEEALAQAPKNSHALWGIAAVEVDQKQYESAKQHLELLLKEDLDYKFGEASLVYGTVLFELKEWAEAKKHLQDDIKRWSHPEASLMLANIQLQDGETEAAKENLERMMFKLKASPRFHYRKKQHLFRQAQRILKTM
ncbi:MAG: tetratricopeptide repeat protein [Cyanobacteria bacterium P01_E01_bin.6]